MSATVFFCCLLVRRRLRRVGRVCHETKQSQIVSARVVKLYKWEIYFIICSGEREPGVIRHFLGWIRMSWMNVWSWLSVTDNLDRLGILLIPRTGSKVAASSVSGTLNLSPSWDPLRRRHLRWPTYPEHNAALSHLLSFVSVFVGINVVERCDVRGVSIPIYAFQGKT